MIIEDGEPCPFCGNKLVPHWMAWIPRESVMQYQVVCVTCGARGPLSESLVGATDAWNKRKAESNGNPH